MVEDLQLYLLYFVPEMLRLKKDDIYSVWLKDPHI